jgi:hypothetical protein
LVFVKNSITGKLTSGMQAVSVESAFGTLRELDGCQDVRRLRLEVCALGGVLLRIRVFDGLEVDSGAKCVGAARDKDHPRSVARRRGCEQFLGKQFGEEKWADVVGCDLALQTVNSELERTDCSSGVMDENLENDQ